MTHPSPAPHRPTPWTGAAALLALALLAAGPPALTAQMPSDSVLRGFQRTGDYLLVVDGKKVPNAEVYLNERVPAFLIVASALPSPVLLSPRAQSAETVHIMKVAKQQDGSVDLLADATLAPLGKFEMEGENVTFQVEGKKVSLQPKPPLLGLKKAAELKGYSPEYTRTAQSYTPNAQALAALKQEGQPVTVRVFFGSWCGFCKRYVPYALKVDEALAGSKVKFEYYGLPRDIVSDAQAKKYNVRSVPTGIVYRNGKEVGRLNGNDWQSPETAIRKVLGG
jgi:thiol-disulfide isomerase/thioredoxin